jgi:hypothetical protein
MLRYSSPGGSERGKWICIARLPCDSKTSTPLLLSAVRSDYFLVTCSCLFWVHDIWVHACSGQLVWDSERPCLRRWENETLWKPSQREPPPLLPNPRLLPNPPLHRLTSPSPDLHLLPYAVPSDALHRWMESLSHERPRRRVGRGCGRKTTTEEVHATAAHLGEPAGPERTSPAKPPERLRRQGASTPAAGRGSRGHRPRHGASGRSAQAPAAAVRGNRRRKGAAMTGRNYRPSTLGCLAAAAVGRRRPLRRLEPRGSPHLVDGGALRDGCRGWVFFHLFLASGFLFLLLFLIPVLPWFILLLGFGRPADSLSKRQLQERCLQAHLCELLIPIPVNGDWPII